MNDLYLAMELYNPEVDANYQFNWELILECPDEFATAYEYKMSTNTQEEYWEAPECSF